MKSEANYIIEEEYRSESQFNAIFEGIAIAFAICELVLDKHGKPKDYRFLRINPAFEKQTGLKNYLASGKTVKEIYPDIEQFWIDRYGSVVLEKKPIQFIDYNHNTGKTYSVNAHSFAENKFVIFFEDITAQRSSEEYLRKSKKEYDQLFHSMNEIFQVIELIYDEEDNVVDYSYLKVNPAFEKLVQKQKEDLIGKRAKELFGSVEDHWLRTYEKVDKTGKSETYENHGVELHRHYLINAWRIEKAKIAVVSTDITELRRLERTLLESHRLCAIGEMASSIAHDVNNALQSISGNLEIAKLQNNLSEPTLGRLNNISSTIVDIAGRVKALQRFGETKKDLDDTELICFNTLIRECIEQSRPLWKDKMEKEGLIVTIATDFGAIPTIDGNQGELKSAIYNLIKNSVEAMPEGGDISIKTTLRGEHVFMTIKDTGIGMDEETKIKLFQPFYTTKNLEPGRGLGMSGVYSIVKRHDGDIKIKFSEQGKGTTIQMGFPRSKKDRTTIIKEKITIDKESFRIIWVDDDFSIRESSCEMLEFLGHNCEPIANGKNALDYLDENPCDIVITDLGMPEMNGWQLADKIRERTGNKIKIIVVSGWEIDEVTKAKHRVNNVLQKPFSVEELENMIKNS